MGKIILGVVIGIVVGFGLKFGADFINNNSNNTVETSIHYNDKSKPYYRTKKEGTFTVFQVLDGGALAYEESNPFAFLTGTFILLLGNDFYTDQTIQISNPMVIGTYSYTTKKNREITVPVIEGEIK
jgi:hypothetical protein